MIIENSLSRKLRLSARFWPVLVVLLVLVIGSLLFLGKISFSLLAVTTIICRTQYGPCSPVTERAFSGFKGEQFFLLDRGEVRTTALSLSGVEDVWVRKQIPNTLIVDLTVGKPVVALDVGDGVGDRGKFLLLTENGEPIAQATTTSLPKLSLATTSDPPGETIVKRALVLLAEFGQSGFNARGKIQGENILLTIGNTEVLIPLAKDPLFVIGSLQLMLDRFTIEGKQPRKIDLRFKNPVVRFK